MDWQPIETAPKDGAEILGAYEWQQGSWEYYVIWWDGGGWAADGGFGAERPRPSHWCQIKPPNDALSRADVNPQPNKNSDSASA